MTSEYFGQKPTSVRRRAVTVIAVAALLSFGCTADDDSEVSSPSTPTETTAADTTTSAPADIGNELLELPAAFEGRTISSNAAIGNLAPDTSQGQSGTVSASEVAVYTLTDEPGDGTRYEVSITSDDGQASVSIYGPDGPRVATGPGVFTIDAETPGEYLIIVFYDGDSASSTSFELTVAGKS